MPGLSPTSGLSANGVVYATDSSGNITGLAGNGGTNVYPFLGSLSTANTSAAATANTAAIQAALNAGGLVQITTPGAYYINSTLIYYDNTRIALGPSTILRQLAGTSLPMFKNSNYAAPVITAGSSITTASGLLNGIRICAVTVAGLGATAGGYVLIQGDTSGNYNGVHQVISYSGSTLVFWVMATSDPGSSSGTITVCLANGNVILEGGYLDYNGTVNQSGGSTPNSCAFLANKVKNVFVRNQVAQNGTKYMYYFGSADNYGVENITFDTNSDGVHTVGPAWKGRFTGIRGQTGDDMIGFTTTNLNYSAINMPDCNGNIVDTIINDVQEEQGSNHRTILLEANEGYGYIGVKINGVQSERVGYIAVHITSQDATSGFHQDVQISGISGGYGTTKAVGAVTISGPSTSGTLTVGDVNIDGIAPSALTSGAELIAVTGRLTFKTIKARNVVQRPLSVKNVAFINGANVTGDQFIIENSRADMDSSSNAGANAYMVSLANASVKNIIIDKCYLTTAGAVVRVHGLCFVFAPGTTTRVDVSRSYHDGSSLCCTAGSVTNVPTFALSQTRHNGGYGISIGNDACNINLSQVEILASSFGAFLNLGGTSKTYGLETRGIRNTAAATLMAYGTTNTFNITGSDGSMTFKTDTAGHTFNISTGAILNDTQAASPGIYAKGPTAYTRIAA